MVSLRDAKGPYAFACMPTSIRGPYRVIGCPDCRWTSQMPRRNALVVAAKLRRQLREHWEARHGEGASNG